MTWNPFDGMNRLQTTYAAITGQLQKPLQLLSAMMDARKSGKAISKQLERQGFYHKNQDIKTWKAAVALARAAENPSRVSLVDVYDNILIDSHLQSLVDSRIEKILGSNFALYNANGEIDQEKSDLLQKPWFNDFLKTAMRSRFRGTQVFELAELQIDPLLSNVRAIPEKHILPLEGLIVERPGDTTGWAYREAPLNTYYIQMGGDDDLGILENVAPLAFAKKYAIGCWTDFIEKFGIPPRYVSTRPGTDDTRKGELLTMLQNMISSAVAVVEEGEEITVEEFKGVDAHNTFNELIKRMNSEMSKRILGQDSTSTHEDAKGTYGSLQIQSAIAEDRHNADKAFLRDLINLELLPRLVLMGWPLAGYAFDWDGLVDLPPMQLIDAIAKLDSAGFEVDFEYVQQKTGIQILGRKAAQAAPMPFAPNPEPVDPKKKRIADK